MDQNQNDIDIMISRFNKKKSCKESLNNKVYNPRELNNILLKKSKNIASEYANVSVRGDIINYLKWKNSGCSFDIITNEVKNSLSFFKRNLGMESITCKVWESSGILPDNVECYLNTKCLISGSLSADYFHGHRFTINVESITIVNNDTKLKELKALCEKNGYFKNKKKVNWNNIKNIGIISKTNTQGYDDFCNQFNVPIDTTLQEISLEGSKTSKECIDSILALQDTDLILLIRGGGNTNEISNSFDNIKLFHAIKESTIPIITAIGHEQDKGDKLLITNVSDVDFPTPTALAKDLNKLFYDPLHLKIDTHLDYNKKLFNNLFEKSSNNLFKVLQCHLETVLKDKFGGQIIKIKNDETHVIVQKDNKYYKQELNFNNQMQFTEKDIFLKRSLLDALECEDIDNLKNIFNKINVDKHILTSTIQRNINKIIKNNKIQADFDVVCPKLIKKYYLNNKIKSKSLTNLVKIQEMLLWYKQQLKESINTKDINEIKIIYNFIKNDI